MTRHAAVLAAWAAPAVERAPAAVPSPDPAALAGLAGAGRAGLADVGGTVADDDFAGTRAVLGTVSTFQAVSAAVPPGDPAALPRLTSAWCALRANVGGDQTADIERSVPGIWAVATAQRSAAAVV